MLVRTADCCFLSTFASFLKDAGASGKSVETRHPVLGGSLRAFGHIFLCHNILVEAVTVGAEGSTFAL